MGELSKQDHQPNKLAVLLTYVFKYDQESGLSLQS